jgi:hypothetical protein
MEFILENSEGLYFRYYKDIMEKDVVDDEEKEFLGKGEEEVP